MPCRPVLRLLAAFVALAAFAVSSAHAQGYPNRPITLIVPWGAGGGTDATARIIGTLMEKELKQPVNVVNRTGGSGVVGHAAIAQAAPDGYTIGLITVEIGMMHWQGLTDIKATNYTPLGLVNADPAGLQVRADSPYKTAKDVVDAVRANPGKLKASGTGQGGIWHLAIAGMLKGLSIDPASVPWVPSQGAAPGLQDLVAGGVDLVPCSIPEARALIDAGKVRSPDDHGREPASAVSEHADHQAGARHRLGRRRMARDGGATRHSQGCRDAPGRGHQGGLRLQGVQGLHGRARLRRRLHGAGGAGGSSWKSRAPTSARP